MRKIAVFTGTRAEYGLLYWTIKRLSLDKDIQLQLIATNMHLSPQYGETWKEIVNDGFTIDESVEMLLSSNTSVGIAKSMGLGTIGFADALNRLKPDMLVILGDRFEALAAAQTALILKIPIAHIHGGELTLAAYDNAIRHAITKMASLHFTAADIYRLRVIQMGESPDTVFNVGAPGLEHVIKTPLLSFEALKKTLNIPLKQPFAMVTYHPETLSGHSPAQGFQALLNALDHFSDYHLLFTAPNADHGNYDISTLLEGYCQKNRHRAFLFKSLGYTYYLSAVSHCHFAIGNSSSAIIEVPAFKIPSINIGTRQQGRLAASSVVHCDSTTPAIIEAIQTINTPEHQIRCEEVMNPYGDGQVSSRIVSTLKNTTPSLLKTFYDIKELHAID